MAWQEDLIPEDLTVDHGGQKISMRELPFVKESADFPAFLNRSIEAHREIGRRLPLPTGQSKPEEIANWKKEHLPKLIKAGVVSAPPELPGAPEKYNVTRPETVPETAWSEDVVKEFRTIAHEDGLTQKTVDRLLALEAKRFNDLQAIVKISTEEAEKQIKERATKGGLDYKEVMEYGGRFLEYLERAGELTQDDVTLMSKSGLANHPRIAWVLYRAGKAMGEDISETGTETQHKAAETRIAEIVADKKGPYWDRSHPGHDQAVNEVYELNKMLNPGMVTP